METIRSECLKFCIGFTALIGLTLLYEGIWSLDTGLTSGIRIVSSLPADIWIACACFCCGALLAVNLRSRSSQAASWALCLFTATGLFAILIDAETPYGVLGFLLPILFSAFLFNWKQMTFFSGLTLAASVYLEINNFSGSFPVAKAVPPVMVGAGGGGLSPAHHPPHPIGH